MCNKDNHSVFGSYGSINKRTLPILSFAKKQSIDIYSIFWE
ncbi:MAG: hypothetical protein ACI85I_002555 [Arenicella sp.]